ncbi:MAG: biotin--[acetyl-CoA-carboxylase] ligase [Calditrichaeota bacterium]|nr:biotin--[acetyl-CoA-carboxylase] ligase [Calditrichota bacterium]
MDPSKIRALLAAPERFNFVFAKSLGSTNDRARELAENGAPAWTVVCADEQTAGRGRLGRHWQSLTGYGLWMSVVLRPEADRFRPGLLVLSLALAVARAIETLGGENLPVRLKWPNDVWVGSRKLAGILMESQFSGSRPVFLIVGIGVNMLHLPADFPDELHYPATSLKMLMREVPSRETLLAGICEHLYRELSRDSDPRLIRKLYLEKALFLGEEIELRTDREVLRGRFAGLSTDGFLQLESAHGIVEITSGDVFGHF